MSSAAVRPLGSVTRGTTAAGRLRRVDRWLLATHAGLRSLPDLLVVDLGFGASPVTTFELARRVQAVNPRTRVVGLDLDPERVAAARAVPTRLPVEFAVGGFELAGLRPHVVRAFNVLRQYPASDVPGWWNELAGHLAPGGIAIDGTCSESGDLATWVQLDPAGPRTLTLAVDTTGAPSAVAARLPKALIERNVPGEHVHALLSDLDVAWHRAAALAVWSTRQRFAAAVRTLRTRGWPVLDGPSRWRRGELTVAWRAVAPRGG